VPLTVASEQGNRRDLHRSTRWLAGQQHVPDPRGPSRRPPQGDGATAIVLDLKDPHLRQPARAIPGGPGRQEGHEGGRRRRGADESAAPDPQGLRYHPRPCRG